MASTLTGALGVATIAAAATAIVMFGPSTADAPPGGTSLSLREGGAPVARSIDESGPAETMYFAEGSSISMAPGTRLVPTRNDSGAFHVELERGLVHVEVTPGLARRWRFVAGHMRIDVVGTAFDLAREPGRAHLVMTHGVVRVWAPTLPGGSAWVRAGEELTVVDASAESDEAPIARGPVGIGPEPAARGTRETARPRGVPTPPMLGETRGAVERRPPIPDTTSRHAADLASATFTSEARDTRTPRRSVEAEQSAEELLRLADDARDRGDPHHAAALLERLLRSHPSATVAPVAAVTLGRIEMDVLHRPQRARRAFGRALRLGVPSALRPDVEQRMGRLDRGPEGAGR